MIGLRVAAMLVGLVMLCGLSVSVVNTLVIPRGTHGRLAVFVGRRLVRGVVVFLAGRSDHYETKDRILAFGAPVSLLAIFGTWLAGYLLAYALVTWALVGHSLLEALRQSGSSLLTLGIASSPRVVPTAVHFAAAATGLFLVALEIAYLPTIYDAFNRRETLVTLLESRAGLPAWGPEILARHQRVGILDSLGAFYADWERWAADVDETHTNYVVLVSFRSPMPLRSWVVALLAVLDSAALYLALCPERAPSEARLCLRMGFTCLRSVGGMFRMPFSTDPRPDDPVLLGYDEYLAGVTRLEQAGFPLERSAEEAWPHFRGWRVNYEALAYALADQTNAVPSLWSGPRRNLPGNVEPTSPVDRTPANPEGSRR